MACEFRMPVSVGVLTNCPSKLAVSDLRDLQGTEIRAVRGICGADDFEHGESEEAIRYRQWYAA